MVQGFSRWSCGALGVAGCIATETSSALQPRAEHAFGLSFAFV